MVKIIRWVATIIFTVLFPAFIAANLQKFLSAKHWDEFFLTWWPAMSYLYPLINSSWFMYLFFFSGGIAIALWFMRLRPEKDKAKMLKFGVYWDEQDNPICPNCKTPLSMSGAGSNVLRCVKCKEDFNLRHGDMFYPLNDAIKLVQLLKTGKPFLEIIKAEYWTPKAKSDVTRIVRNLIFDNKLEINVSNELLGVDPDPGTRKSLSIEYKFNGKTLKRVFRERDKVIIP